MFKSSEAAAITLKEKETALASRTLASPATYS